MLCKQKGRSKNWYVVRSIKVDGKWKKKWICTGTADKAEAEGFEREIKATLTSIKEIKSKRRIETFLSNAATTLTGQTVKRSGFQIADVWNAYSKKPVMQSLTPRTISSKKFVWLNFAGWIARNYPDIETINEITPQIANDFLLKNYSKRSTATYNNQRFTLSHIWGALAIDANLPIYGVYKGKIICGPWKLVSCPARKTAKVYRPFTDEEARKILSIAGAFWREASIIANYTGLRLKDIVMLEWRQVDAENKRLELVPHKIARYNKTIAIPLHNDVIAVLNGIPRKAAAVFPEAIEKYKSHDFNLEFGKILKTAGVCDSEKGIVGFHSWRKTFITNAREAGIELEEIRKIAGHSKIEMTEHYDHSKVTEKIREMKSITKGGQ